METDDPALEGAFKTPGLRGVAARPPHMHAGQFATLEQVVRHYLAAPHAAVGHSELTHRYQWRRKSQGGTGAASVHKPLRSVRALSSALP